MVGAADTVGAEPDHADTWSLHTEGDGDITLTIGQRTAMAPVRFTVAGQYSLAMALLRNADAQVHARLWEAQGEATN
jgi:hypothetical protein